MTGRGVARIAARVVSALLLAAALLLARNLWWRYRLPYDEQGAYFDLQSSATFWRDEIPMVAAVAVGCVVLSAVIWWVGGRRER